MRTLTELIVVIDLFPPKLANARDELARARSAAQDMKGKIDDLEADALAEVSLEPDPATGKLKYTNKEAREQAARKRLQGDGAFRQWMDRRNACDVAVQNAQIALSLLEDEQRSLYAQLDAATAEIRAETIRELSRAVLELARYEVGRQARKETS